MRADESAGWDGATVTAWAQAAVAALAAAQRRIDAVNVFPVADGDTGTNVHLTVAGGAQRAAQESPGSGAGQVLAALAEGALLAARGNSGVIVSQYLGGLAGPLRDVVLVTRPEEVVTALRSAAVAARRAVHLPEEGTVVTLAEVVADAAQAAAGRHRGPASLLAEAVGVAHGELGRISAVHPVLRAAGVPDAGACALLVVLDQLVGVTGDPAGSGRDVPAGLQEADPSGLGWLPDVPAGDVPRVRVPDGVFEVMGVVRADDPGWGDEVARRLTPLGDSITVVGSAGVWQVHVHTPDVPGALLALNGGDVVSEQAVVRLVESPPPAARDEQRWGVVACVSSPEAAQALALLHAVVVVTGAGAAHGSGGTSDGGAAPVPDAPGAGLVRCLARAADDAASVADHVVVLAGDPESARAARTVDRPTVVDVVELEGDAQVSDATVLLLTEEGIALTDVRRLVLAQEEER